MNTFRLCACSVLMVMALQAAAQQQDPVAPEVARKERATQEQRQRAEMQREVEEAARAIGTYSAARRDQAMARAREALDAMDKRIQRKNEEWSREAQRQHEQARAARERQDAELRAKRAQAEQRYRDLEASNAQMWARARDSFVRAYRELAARFGAKPAQMEPEGAQQETMAKPHEPADQSEHGD